MLISHFLTLVWTGWDLVLYILAFVLEICIYTPGSSVCSLAQKDHQISLQMLCQLFTAVSLTIPKRSVMKHISHIRESAQGSAHLARLRNLSWAQSAISWQVTWDCVVQDDFIPVSDRWFSVRWGSGVTGPCDLPSNKLAWPWAHDRSTCERGKSYKCPKALERAQIHLHLILSA